MEQKKQAILAVSFGTSHEDTRKKTIDVIEAQIRNTFPEWEVRRAFTSGMILQTLKQRDGIHIDNVRQAMVRLAEDGYEKVFLQPTHIMNGDEFDKLVSQAREEADRFQWVKTGKPLLTSSDDYQKTCHGIMKSFPDLKREEALVLMGHGTGHFADAAYAALDYRFKALGYHNVFVGTVEGYPELEEILPMIREYNPKKVLLLPFMIVAGDHAKNDMAGEESDSWKSIFKKEGYCVECILKGMGEFPEIREIFMEHIRDGLQEQEE